MKKYFLLFLLVLLIYSCNSTNSDFSEEEGKNRLATQIVATITAEAKKEDEIQDVLPTETVFIPTSTPLPDPIILEGNGDSVVDIENPFVIAIVHIVGNQSGGHFVVKNYDKNGNSIDLLVNTTDPYDGKRPLDFRYGEQTTRFEITSSGEWKIEILPITTARILQVPGTIEGYGDDVIYLAGANPDLAIIRGNKDSHHFAVKSYGTDSDLLVNTTDPYEGTVMIDSDAILIEVDSESNWSIELTSK